MNRRRLFERACLGELNCANGGRFEPCSPWVRGSWDEAQVIACNLMTLVEALVARPQSVTGIARGLRLGLPNKVPVYLRDRS